MTCCGVSIPIRNISYLFPFFWHLHHVLAKILNVYETFPKSYPRPHYSAEEPFIVAFGHGKQPLGTSCLSFLFISNGNSYILVALFYQLLYFHISKQLSGEDIVPFKTKPYSSSPHAHIGHFLWMSVISCMCPYGGHAMWFAFLVLWGEGSVNLQFPRCLGNERALLY